MLYQLSYSRIVGAVGFEPTQHEAPDLQSGPALQLRRAPNSSEPMEGLEPPTR